MNKIDEIALRVAENGIGRMVSNVDICDFAHALLAELSKDAAPVSASEQKPVAWVDVIDRHEGPYNFNGLELLDSGKHLLFTSPPSPADIEKRVAEACRKSVLSEHLEAPTNEADDIAYDNAIDDAAVAIRKWREYL